MPPPLEKPLWTPSLFGWQYPIDWHTEYAGIANVRGLPRSADIWRMPQGLWVATFDCQLTDGKLTMISSKVIVVEQHASLATVIRRFERKTRAFLRALQQLASGEEPT